MSAFQTLHMSLSTHIMYIKMERCNFCNQYITNQAEVIATTLTLDLYGFNVCISCISQRIYCSYCNVQPIRFSRGFVCSTHGVSAICLKYNCRHCKTSNDTMYLVKYIYDHDTPIRSYCKSCYDQH